MALGTWNIPVNDGDNAFAHELQGPEGDDRLLPIQLSIDTTPVKTTADLVERARRLDRFRAACRDIYSYVDELDGEARETGDCGADAMTIIDEVKRLISKAYL